MISSDPKTIKAKIAMVATLINNVSIVGIAQKITLAPIDAKNIVKSDVSLI
jgi:hypothetical protein